MDLTLAEYLERGGLERALERHADAVFKRFSQEQRGLARTVFSRLVEVGQVRVATRRTATLTELVPAGEKPEQVQTVVRAFAEEGVRLLTTGVVEVPAAATGAQADEGVAPVGETLAAEGEAGEKPAHPTVSIAHEKLIDAWPWLRRLVDENRKLIALQNQIHDDARAWAEDRDPGFLYRGGRLLQVEEQLQALPPGLDTLSQEFIQASLDRRQQEIEEREARRRRTILLLSGGTTVALALALVAFIFFGRANRSRRQAEENLALATAALVEAATERSRADGNAATATRHLATAVAANATAEANRAAALQQARITQSQALAVAAEAESGDDRVLAAQLALEAERAAQTGLAFAALHRTIKTVDRSERILTHDDVVVGAAWNEDESRLLTWSEDGTARVWAAEDGTLLRKLGYYSRKNRPYKAFRKLGRVICTIFLLRFISDLPIGRKIEEETNKVRAYHGFTGWLRFGSGGVISHNTLEEPQKWIRYNDLVANAIMPQNVVDMPRLLPQLAAEGYAVNAETLQSLSTYMCSHIKHLGTYRLDLEQPRELLGIDPAAFPLVEGVSQFCAFLSVTHAGATGVFVREMLGN